MEAVFDISLPTSWADLTDKQLLLVFNLFARDLSAAEAKTLCLMKWCGLEVKATLPEQRFIVKKKGGPEMVLHVRQLQQAIACLDFLESLSPVPVRISRIGRHKAAPADFDGVPFENFLYCDNLYQGYLETKKADFLTQMAEVLYHHDGIHLTAAEQISVFYWFASLKAWLSKRFSHFFLPVITDNQDDNGLGATPDIGKQLQQSMDAQIRALTGGDITKEQQVLKFNTQRALTELDAKAKEAEEYRRASKQR